MQQRNNQRITDSALEQIMQDVMEGVRSFTSETYCGSDTGDLDIIAVATSDFSMPHIASVIPFPLASSRKK